MSQTNSLTIFTKAALMLAEADTKPTLPEYGKDQE